MSISSCYKYQTLNQVSDEDLYNYVKASTYDPSYSDSPLSYNVIKGSNPCNEYDWKIVIYSDFQKNYFGRYYTYVGDKSKLVCRAYPNADIIMIYNDKFYIGIKKDTGDKK
jgi:hypothetical protein